jgi:hypothetical protein
VAFSLINTKSNNWFMWNVVPGTDGDNTYPVQLGKPKFGVASTLTQGLWYTVTNNGDGTWTVTSNVEAGTVFTMNGVEHTIIAADGAVGVQDDTGVAEAFTGSPGTDCIYPVGTPFPPAGTTLDEPYYIFAHWDVTYV